MESNGFVPGLISIIVPVYNTGHHLIPCIESAIGQSYDNIELLLIDDGSADGSGKVCDEYARRDSRIRVEHLSNGGPASARNTGIAKSRGEFLFFLDSDDLIEKNAMLLLKENQARTHADLTVSDFATTHFGEREVDSKFLFPEDALLLKRDVVNQAVEYLRKPTAHALLTYVWGKLFRASLLKDNRILFNTQQRIFEDIDLNIRYLHYASSVSYIKDKLYIYTGYPNAGATASGLYTDPLAYKVVLNTIQMFLISSGVPTAAVRRDIGNAHVYFAIRIMIALFRYSKQMSLWKTRGLISVLVNDPDVRENLEYYSPAKGNSRAIPHLMRWRLTVIIVAVCLYRARSRRVSIPKTLFRPKLANREVTC